METGEGKLALRARLRAERDGSAEAYRREADTLILAGVLSTVEYRESETLLCYLDFGSEVSTRRLVSLSLDMGKEVALPRCEGRHELSWHVIEGLEGLVRNPLGIDEPDPALCAELPADRLARALCVVPGLVFDRQGYRLGYGGGYYDKFLSSFPGRTVGLCREAQMVEDLRELGVLESHDVPVGAIVTDERIYRRFA